MGWQRLIPWGDGKGGRKVVGRKDLDHMTLVKIN